jgi:sarcosine oxidase subunit alpha
MPNARLITGISPGRSVCFTYEGQRLEGYEGEGIAAALLRAGIARTRMAPRTGEPRGYYCGMGLCWECVLDVAGEGSVRGCLYPVREGLVVRAAVARPEEDL